VPRKILGVIPARFHSTRFPGKVLATLASKPMVQHVYERASLSKLLTSTIIATDSELVFDAAQRFGARVRMTSPHHATGSDRVAEIAATEDADLIVNIQGDEPLIDPGAIDAAIQPMLDHPQMRMATLKKKIHDPREIADLNTVKVVTDLTGHALYFSRSPIPGRAHASAPMPVHYKHIGLYVYERLFLLNYSALPTGPLEKSERLEQLRALENGYRIRVVETEYDSLGVDTPEDLHRVSLILENLILENQILQDQILENLPTMDSTLTEAIRNG